MLVVEVSNGDLGAVEKENSRIIIRVTSGILEEGSCARVKDAVVCTRHMTESSKKITYLC